MAMRRTIADLVTRFRVTGLDGMRQQLARAAAGVRQSLQRIGQSPAMQGLKKGAEQAAKAIQATGRAAAATARHIGTMAKAAAGVGAKVGAAAAAFSIAGAGKTTADLSNNVLAINRLSKQLGLSFETMSALVTRAQDANLELDDMAGSFSQFAEKIAEGLQGNDEPFKALGISVKDANGNAKDFVQVLDEVARAQSKLSGAAKNNALAQLFGGGDVNKVIEFLDQIGGYDTDLASKLEATKKALPVYTEQDLAIAKEYRYSMLLLRDAFQKLRIQIFRAFGPQVNRLIQYAAHYLDKYATVIVGKMIDGWNYLVRVIRTFFGWSEQLGSQDVGWVIKLKEGFARIEELLKRLGIEWPKLVQSFKQGWAFAKVLLSDLLAVITFSDHNIQTEIGKSMRDWRDAIIAGISDALGYVTGLVGQIASIIVPALDYIRGAWSALMAGFTGAEFNGAFTVWYSLGAVISTVTGFVVELTKQLWNMIVLGQDASGGFAWLNTVRDWFALFSNALQTAWGWLMQLHDAINSVLHLFGTDLTTVLLFVGLLRLTGLLGLVTGAFGLVLKALKLVWAAFMSQTAIAAFTTALGAGGALGAIRAFIAVGLANLAAALGPGGLAIAGLAYFSAAVVAFYKLLEMSPVNDWMKGITDAIFGVDQALNQRAATDAAFIASGGAKRGSGPVDTRPAVASTRAYGDIPKYITDGQYANYGSGRTTNFNVTVGNGPTVHTRARQSEVDAALRAAQLSMTGGL